MIIWYHPYQLQPHSSLNVLIAQKNLPREGVLLKVQFYDGGIGYADCHPLEEFGDLSWQEQIQSLRADRPLPLITRSLEMAQWDASARRENKSLFPESPLLKSHYTLTDPSQLTLALLEQLVVQEYDTIKIKVGHEIGKEFGIFRRLLPIMPENIKIRLDFNMSGSFDRLGEHLENLGSDFLHRLDFIEDPFVYDEKKWCLFREKWKVPLALDLTLSAQHHENLEAVDVLVVKPMRLSSEQIERYIHTAGDKRWVFTHSMDHPLARMMALAFAMNFYRINPEKEEVGGFEGAPFFVPTSFDEHIYQQGALQLGTDGTGIGLAEPLENLSWQTLNSL